MSAHSMPAPLVAITPTLAVTYARAGRLSACPAASPAPVAAEDERLVHVIEELHASNCYAYGYRRM